MTYSKNVTVSDILFFIEKSTGDRVDKILWHLEFCFTCDQAKLLICDEVWTLFSDLSPEEKEELKLRQVMLRLDERFTK